jgi:DNA-binding GntR family transcriptional regulator
MRNFSQLNIPKTLSQSIYHSLKEAIINNEFKPGQRIYEKEIAKIYSVSTTPVREALLRLNAEDYISIDSHRKVAVRNISFEELTDIFDVMGDLDALAISQAVDYISPECIQEIEELIIEMENTCTPTYVEKFLELNAAIHSKIWSALPNKVLERTLHFVHGQLLRYNYARYVAYQDPDIMKQSLAEYKEILSALSDGKKKELKKLVKTHWSFLIKHLHVRNKFLTAFKGGETAVES